MAREGLRLPITRLWIESGRLRREDRWPTDTDPGSRVVLPEGKVCTLTAWWHDADGDEWCWSVEFYNHQ